jgi:hypothetical protein
MARVYLSSTISDLKRERRTVMDWLVASGHQPVHSYRPDSDTVQASCLGDVATCDLYVLILGHRYGFQPEQDNPEGLSITHLEYRQAGQADIPRIALLRTSIPDERLSDVNDPQKWLLVRAFRAEVAREVRPFEFRNEGRLIRGLSTGVQAELARLDKRDQRPVERPAGGPVLRLAPRPAFLAGRADLLAGLDDQLAGSEGSGPRVVALCGLGGAGKTSVALEYAHRHLGEVEVAWQFPAEDQAVLAAAFGELAGLLGAADSGDPVIAVHGVLAAYPAKWLLLFDNAPGRASVAAFVPPAGRGRVLITSRNQIWPPGQALDVPVLERDIAAQFLSDRTGDQDRRAALALADELGGLPLALEQAAAYIQASGDSLAGYLASFRQRRADLLSRGEPTGYSETVATTWTLAFQDLQQAAPEAVGLLQLLANCAPEAIPLNLLLQSRPGLGDQLSPEVAPVLVPLLEDELAAKDAIASLRRYSLISTGVGGSVSVHRLVQAVTVDQMPAGLAEPWRQATAAVIEAAIPEDPEQPGNWPVFAALLPHAQAAFTADSDVMGEIAAYLGWKGSYVAAQELSRKMLEARARVFGPEHPRTLNARAYVAYWTGAAGDAVGARDQYATLLPIRERVSGSDDRDTLVTRSNLARWTGLAGEAVRACDQYAAVVSAFERALGPEHRDTLVARQDLAHWTGAAGDAAGARDQFAALLLLFEHLSGPEHPHTVTVRSNLALWIGQAGDAAGAREQYAALLPIRERVSGPEHPDTLRLRASLARFTGEAGDAAGARDQFAALLPVRDRVSGAQHPETVAARDNLAYWTEKARGEEGRVD